MAAVEKEGLPGHEVGGGGGQVDHQRADLLEPAGTARRARRGAAARGSRGSPKASAFMSVTNQPGAIALTWMSWRAHSAASARVNPITPLLDAA